MKVSNNCLDQSRNQVILEINQGMILKIPFINLIQFSLEDVIRYDISKKPIWELSCYGLNVSWEGGRNVVVGDLSQEELRLEAYAQHMLLGNINNYMESWARARAEKSVLFKRVAEETEQALQIARTPLYSRQTPQIPVVAVAPVSVQPTIKPASSHESIGSIADNPVRPVFSFGSIPELPPG